MAEIHEWNAYLNLLHEYALVEDDLRNEVLIAGNVPDGASALAAQILFERFGVRTGG